MASGASSRRHAASAHPPRITLPSIALRSSPHRPDGRRKPDAWARRSCRSNRRCAPVTGSHCATRRFPEAKIPILANLDDCRTFAELVVSRLEAKESHVELLGPFDVRHYYGKLGDAVVPKVQFSNLSVQRWTLEVGRRNDRVRLVTASYSRRVGDGEHPALLSGFL